MKPMILRIAVSGFFALSLFHLQRFPSKTTAASMAFLEQCLQLCNSHTPAEFRDGAVAELERLRSADEPTIE